MSGYNTLSWHAPNTSRISNNTRGSSGFSDIFELLAVHTTFRNVSPLSSAVPLHQRHMQLCKREHSSEIRSARRGFPQK